MMKGVSKTKNSSNSSNTFKKRINRQQTQKNSGFQSSNKSSKRPKQQQQQQQQRSTIGTGKSTMTTSKLPTISKKTSPLTSNQSISSAYIQDSFQKLNPTVVREPIPTKLFQPHLPPIKDYVIRDNLTQKATLRCKTPQPGSFYDRSMAVIPGEFEQTTKTRHPLQRMDVASLLSESARKRLKKLFNKLDTDHDGHLLYTQLQRCLPSNLPRAQLTFLHVLYEVISEATFFGLQEFFTIAIVVEMIAKQDSTLWNTYLDDVDFNYYHKNIIELLDQFNSRCVGDRGIISYENLLQIILQRTSHDKTDRITYQLEYVMPKIKSMKINRLDFLALLPVIIYIESSFNHGCTLFRFRDNSILDLDTRRVLLV